MIDQTDEWRTKIEAKLDRILELLDPMPDHALSARVESLRERIHSLGTASGPSSDE